MLQSNKEASKELYITGFVFMEGDKFIHRKSVNHAYSYSGKGSPRVLTDKLNQAKMVFSENIAYKEVKSLNNRYQDHPVNVCAVKVHYSIIQ